MADFGWSYPPGCSGVPDDDAPECQEAERVRELLEEAGTDEAIIDEVETVILNLAAEANRECERCLANDWVETEDPEE